MHYYSGRDANPEAGFVLSRENGQVKVSNDEKTRLAFNEFNLWLQSKFPQC
jgi:hypothetical protein